LVGAAEEAAEQLRMFPVNGRPGAKEIAEKVHRKTKNVPQRLKPHYKQSTCGTAEAVPLSKTDFFSTLLKPLVIWPLIQRPEDLCSLRVRALARMFPAYERGAEKSGSAWRDSG
jgi:hypothetical protein